MLVKLLKYDLKRLLKLMSPVYLGIVLLAVVSRCGYYIQDSVSILNVTVGFVFALFIMGVIFLPFITIIMGSVYFYKNVVKDEGYLTNTLPVTKSNIIISKSLSFIMVFAISGLVSVGTFFIGTIGSYVTFDHLKDFIDFCLELIGLVPSSVVLLVITMIISFIMQQLMIYLAISFGQRHNKNKGVMSFVYLIVIYYAVQIIMALILVGIFNLKSDWSKYLNTNMPPTEIFNIILIIVIVVSLIISGVYYFLTNYNLSKKLNLE